MRGKNSELGKSLRCIKQLGLVDPKRQNVVTILTHACSIRKRTDEEWTKELDEIKSDVLSLVFEDLKVYTPVVVIENKFDDCGLEHDGDYTRLQNEELQPKNLYLACADLLKNNNDNLGLITLNSIFVQPNKSGDAKIKCGHKVEAKNAAQQHTLDSEEKVKVEVLQLAAKGGTSDDYTSFIV
jgi:hypothetical protein